MRGVREIRMLDEGVTLVLGDARDYSHWERAQLVLADIPYELTRGGLTQKTHFNGRSRWAESYTNNGKPVTCELSVRECAFVAERYAAERSDIMLMADARNMRALTAAAESVGIRHHNILVWDKITGNQNRWYMKNVEFTFYGFKGKARAIRNCGHQALQRFMRPAGAEHMTQKPVPLMRLYIEDCSDVGDLVADPFMGSGSTGVAAVKAHRRFLGVEVERDEFELACRRIARALETRGSAPDLFTYVGPELEQAELEQLLEEAGA